MTDKEIEEKKKEFFEKFVTEIEHYQGESEPLIEAFIRDDKVEELWQWIEKLIKEVEKKSFKEGFRLGEEDELGSYGTSFEN